MLTNNFMDTLQVSPSSPPVTRNTVLFGDMKRYIIRRVKGMSLLRLEERFADFQGDFFGGRFSAAPVFA